MEERQKTEDWNIRQDALFYLKEYKFITENCADALAEKYPSENSPLSWDELKQMEGKPVFVKDRLPYNTGWKIIQYVTTDNHGISDAINCLAEIGSKKTLYRKDLGKTWQAYRKERR